MASDYDLLMKYGQFFTAAYFEQLETDEVTEETLQMSSVWKKARIVYLEEQRKVKELLNDPTFIGWDE